MNAKTKFPLPFLSKIEQAVRGRLPNFDWKEMEKIHRMKIKDFHSYGQKVNTRDGVYYYKDNGADILFVAHLDSVQGFRHFNVTKLCDDTLIFGTNLDDRLGVYLGLKYLQDLGIKYDILLTENEEKGQSTASWFEPPPGKQYKWMFSFDRAGTGAVTYQYKSPELKGALEDVGLRVGIGSYSCIANLEYLGCEGINFAVGYEANHTTRAYASKLDLVSQIRAFLKFYQNNKNTHFYHAPPYNVFTFADGWEYDASVKEDCFSQLEFKYGDKLMEESDKSQLQSRINYEQRLTKKDFRRMMYKDRGLSALLKPIQPIPTEDIKYVGDPSVDESLNQTVGDFKMGIGVIHHPDISPHEKSVMDIVNEAQARGTKALALDKCVKCGNEYSPQGVQVLCSKCQDAVGIASSPIPKTKIKEKQAERQAEILQFTQHYQTGRIKTKMPINLGSVSRTYGLVVDVGGQKVFRWIEKIEPGFQPVTRVESLQKAM